MTDFNIKTTSISIGRQYNLGVNHRSVVQKGNVGSTYLYALQLRDKQKTTHVLRGTPGMGTNTSVLTLTGNAAGHTQTWEYSGKSHRWFIGTKPNSSGWAKQIARVDITTMGGTHYSNTDFPRLAYLNRAGNQQDWCSGTDMKRVEIALSPDYSQFLVANAENDGTGHFAIYPTYLINNALDQVEAQRGFVNIGDIPCTESFTIPGFVSVNGSSALINSIQGYDIDNAGNIYVTSQKSPYLDVNGNWTVHHKQIVKIPYYSRTNTDSWRSVNLSGWGGIDLSGKHSEVESLQVINEDHAYVTVAYHANVNGSNKTVLNMIYELSWTW